MALPLELASAVLDSKISNVISEKQEVFIIWEEEEWVTLVTLWELHEDQDITEEHFYSSHSGEIPNRNRCETNYCCTCNDRNISFALICTGISET